MLTVRRHVLLTEITQAVTSDQGQAPLAHLAYANPHKQSGTSSHHFLATSVCPPHPNYTSGGQPTYFFIHPIA